MPTPPPRKQPKAADPKPVNVPNLSNAGQPPILHPSPLTVPNNPVSINHGILDELIKKEVAGGMDKLLGKDPNVVGKKSGDWGNKFPLFDNRPVNKGVLEGLLREDPEAVERIKVKISQGKVLPAKDQPPLLQTAIIRQYFPNDEIRQARIRPPLPQPRHQANLNGAAPEQQGKGKKGPTQGAGG